METTMAQRIQTIIQAKKITKLKFSKDIGCSSGFVTQLTKGQTNPSNSTIKLICQTYGVSEAWLRTGEGEMFAAAPQTALDALAASHPDITALQRAIIAGVLRLTEEEQAAVLKLCQDIVAGYGANAGQPDAPALDIDAEVAAYRAELEAETEAAAKSEALPATGESTGSRKEA